MANPIFKLQYVSPKSDLRGWFGLSSEDNFLHYMTRSDGVQESLLATAGYSDKIFNNTGRLTRQQIRQIVKRIRSSQGMVWVGFFDTDPENAAALDNVSKAIFVTQKCFPPFFKDIDETNMTMDRIDMLCTLHTDVNHPHVHFLFAEREPRYIDSSGKEGCRRFGSIPKSAVTRMRDRLREYLQESAKNMLSVEESVTKTLQETFPPFNDRDMRNFIVNATNKIGINNLRETHYSQFLSMIVNSKKEYADAVISATENLTPGQNKKFLTALYGNIRQLFLRCDESEILQGVKAHTAKTSNVYRDTVRYNKRNTAAKVKEYLEAFSATCEAVRIQVAKNDKQEQQYRMR